MESTQKELGSLLAALDNAAGVAQEDATAVEPAGTLCSILDCMDQVSDEGSKLRALQLEATGRELENRYARHVDMGVLRDRARAMRELRDQLRALLELDRNELIARIHLPFSSPHIAMAPEYHPDVVSVVEAASRDIASVKQQEALCKWLHSAAIPEEDLRALADARDVELQRAQRVLASLLRAREVMRALEAVSEGNPATSLS